MTSVPPAQKVDDQFGNVKTGYCSKFVRYAACERGSKDWRMISCLLAVWLGSVASQVLFERYLSPITAAHQQVFSTHLYDVVGTPSLILSVTLLVCCLIVTALWIRATLVGGTHRFQSFLNNVQENQAGSLWTDLFGLGLHLMLLCFVLLASASTGLAHCIVRDRDVAVLTAASHKTVVDARVRVLSPTMVSERRGFDCRNDIRVETITVSGVSAHSKAKARIMLTVQTVELNNELFTRCMRKLRWQLLVNRASG